MYFHHWQHSHYASSFSTTLLIRYGPLIPPHNGRLSMLKSLLFCRCVSFLSPGSRVHAAEWRKPWLRAKPSSVNNNASVRISKAVFLFLASNSCCPTSINDWKVLRTTFRVEPLSGFLSQRAFMTSVRVLRSG